uniref:Putative l-carnitine dehydratase/alpha-methylacyl-coa racemase n=1 Tax=Corethrella appendiculata TaxID=1370023 RepID=U5EV35_9DIPT
MALKGIKVLEFVGLAPGPFCGMVLSDFGANVTRIDRTPSNSLDILQNGKRSIALDLKKLKAIEVVKKLCMKSDVLIEPFRPGVMEKLGLGPDVLMKENPRLIYARLTGFGQSGKLANRAGHDINYLAVSGILSLFGRKDEPPTPPVNFSADFAAGGLLCAFGILAALLERHNSGRGQIVDNSMVEGAAYIGSWLIRAQKLGIFGNKRGDNVLDTGANFYESYETKDGKFMSVGSIEPQFYSLLLEGLKLPADTSQYENMKNKDLFQKIFKTKTQNEWNEIFEDTDACVYPVLELNEAVNYPHNKTRNVFLDIDGEIIPTPAPKLSLTPAVSSVLKNTEDKTKQIEIILNEISLNKTDIKYLIVKK